MEINIELIRKRAVSRNLPVGVCVIDRVLIRRCDPHTQAYTKKGKRPTKKPRGNTRLITNKLLNKSQLFAQ